MLKELKLGLLLASTVFAQSSDVLRPVVDAIANFNPAKAGLENQQMQAAILAARAAAEEAQARAELLRQETERIRLETLPESQRAQQAAEQSTRSAAPKTSAKSLDIELPDARHQMRIEHMKVLALEARQKHPDFDETINRFNCPLNQAMNEAILDSESGAEIIYWLGKHNAECALIADLQPVSAIREIGRIEGTIAPLQQ